MEETTLDIIRDFIASCLCLCLALSLSDSDSRLRRYNSLLMYTPRTESIAFAVI